MKFMIEKVFQFFFVVASVADTMKDQQEKEPDSLQEIPTIGIAETKQRGVLLRGTPPVRLLPDPLPYEDVLCVPPRLTKSAYEILVRFNVAPRAWNLEGRYGSRTHRIEDDVLTNGSTTVKLEHMKVKPDQPSIGKFQQNEMETQDEEKNGHEDNTSDLVLDTSSGEIRNSAQHSKESTMMGLPILSKRLLLEIAEANKELKELLDTPNVTIVRKPFTVSHWANPPPHIDGRIHPERDNVSTQGSSAHVPAIIATASETTQSSSQKECSFTYAELFAGIGGFGVALDALGGQCIFCSELEESCRAVYELNISTMEKGNDNNGQHVIHGDIYEVPDEAFPNHCDLLVAGFPCQPFSALGTQPALDCPKGRGHLFLEIVRFLNKSKPKGFILENVPGLQQLTSTYETIVTSLEEAGYDVYTEVCNARGITATSRKRLFFVGLRKNSQERGDLGNPSAEQENIESFGFPFIPDLGLRALDVIDFYLGESSEGGENIDNKDMGLNDSELVNLLRLSDKTFQQLVDSKRWRPSALAWPSLVLETLISHYGNAVGRGESQLVPGPTPLPPRRLSPRECARLMGFPNSYRLGPRRNELQGDMAYMKERYRMFGNAVCPPLVAAIAGAVLDAILPKRGDSELNWVDFGRNTAIQLAYDATLPAGRQRRLPIAAIPFDNLPVKNPNRRKRKRKLPPQPKTSVTLKNDHSIAKDTTLE